MRDETLHSLAMSTRRKNIEVGGAKPEVRIEPKVVWEVLTAELSLSPICTAAQGLVRVRAFSRPWGLRGAGGLVCRWSAFKM